MAALLGVVNTSSHLNQSKNSQLLLSFKPAYDFLFMNLSPCGADDTMVDSIMDLLIAEALNFSNDWVDTNFKEYAIEAINQKDVPDHLFARFVCGKASDIINEIIVSNVPNFGASVYTGKIKYQVRSAYLVLIEFLFDTGYRV